MCLAALVAATAGAVVASMTTTAGASDLSANPSNLASVFAGANAGDTIMLAGGSYGPFAGGMKPGVVTLKPAPGAAVTMQLSFKPAANITIDGVTLTQVDIGDSATKGITVRNSDIPGQTTFRTGELQNANILFDRNVHRDFDKCSSCGEGRIFLPDSTSLPSGITIQNSEFKGGLSDGIQNGSRGTRILDNTFHDLEQGSPDGVHTDAIQLYGSADTLIKGNYFYDVPDAIMAPDGTDHEIIEDNVIAADSNGYPFAITLFSDNGSIIRHNTFADGACAFNLRCGIVSVGSKDRCSYANECDPGVGTVIEDNVLGEVSNGDGKATVARNTNNLFASRTSGVASLRAKPVFVGGAKPTSYAGYALAAGSPGKGSASDGLDRGINLGAGARPAAGTSPTASVRLLSTLRSIRRTGRLRLRLVTPAAGVVAVSGKVRPGGALPGYRKVHSRTVLRLRTVTLGRRAAGTHTVTFRLGRQARRRLGHSKSASLVVKVTVSGQATSTKLTIRR
jgi:hypothetical protein